MPFHNGPVPARGARDPCPTIPCTVVSFNVMSAVALQRLASLQMIFSAAAAIILQGTRLKLDGGDTFRYGMQNGRHTFNFGFPPGNNKHTGVFISLAARVFPKTSIADIFTPKNKRNQGRLGAVRVRNSLYDITFIGAYFPTAWSDGAARASFWVLVAELRDFLHSLPSRTTPVLCMDGNGHEHK